MDHQLCQHFCCMPPCATLGAGLLTLLPAPILQMLVHVRRPSPSSQESTKSTHATPDPHSPLPSATTCTCDQCGSVRAKTQGQRHSRGLASKSAPDHQHMIQNEMLKKSSAVFLFYFFIHVYSPRGRSQGPMVENLQAFRLLRGYSNQSSFHLFIFPKLVRAEVSGVVASDCPKMVRHISKY